MTANAFYDGFCLRLSHACALPPGSHVLAAVSGGADSVALLRLLLHARERYPLTLSCAHVEHGIRGEDARAQRLYKRHVGWPPRRSGTRTTLRRSSMRFTCPSRR